MFDYIKSLGTQEKLYLSLGAIFVLVIILYQAIWKPIHASVERKKQLVTSKAELLNWMQQATNDLKALQRQSPQPRTDYSTGALLSIIDKTTEKLHVRSFIRRIDPGGDNQVQIWLEGIHFDDLIQLLNILKRNHGIMTDSLALTRKSDQGLVDVRLTAKGVNQ
jgi:type II secretory pathway component PulM